MGYRIFDGDGQERDAAWLWATFGNVKVTEAGTADGADVYRLVEIREKCGPAALVVEVRDLEGEPQDRATVVRYWPDAPELPQWTPPPERWRDRGVHGKTNAEGNIGFGMGHGDYYDPNTQTGASAIWVGEPGAHSDLVEGLGMLAGTEHCHVDLIFQRFESGGPGPGPGPNPPGDAYETIAQGLEMVAAGVRALGS